MIDKTLHFVEEPIEIMDRAVKKQKQSRIPIVKVQWNSRQRPGFTWEREDEMKRYQFDKIFKSFNFQNIFVGFDTELLADSLNSDPQIIRAMQESGERGLIVKLELVKTGSSGWHSRPTSLQYEESSRWLHISVPSYAFGSDHKLVRDLTKLGSELED
ncbi:putative reverse transcriptase domain-containing protein [Tanacetum coccineum]